MVQVVGSILILGGIFVLAAEEEPGPKKLLALEEVDSDKRWDKRDSAERSLSAKR